MTSFYFADNKTHVCYFEEGNSWCGNKDECSSKGLLLPFFLEIGWSTELRGIIYFIGLLYSFLGVSIIADIFMCAIEKITSKTKRITVASVKEDVPEIMEIPIWNGTVANLTLMALGSSAPEILLSIIEILSNDFKAGELGPGTIVGSAAFNLLAISAVCILGVPSGETRRIDRIIVFAITAIFSIFAYIWLLIILLWNTPNIVDLWEAIMTFGFFPILVVFAYSADKSWLDVFFCNKSSYDVDKQRQIELGSSAPGEESEHMLKHRSIYVNGVLDKNELIAYIKDIKKNTKLTEEEAALLAASKIVDSVPHSRMWYRIGAVRSISGGRKTQPFIKMNEKLKEVYDTINENPQAPNINTQNINVTSLDSIVEFHSSTASVMENIGTYLVTIVRYGRIDNIVSVRVESIDGSAKEHEDYVPLDETITFDVNEREKQIGVQIVDDNQWEPDEEFFLKLSLLPGDESGEVKLGKSSIIEITILNDDEPGIFTFAKRGYLVKESCENALISVVRRNGADGDAFIKWRTLDRSAIHGKDYTGGEGTLEFNHGETERVISIPIINDMEFEKDENFEVELLEASHGAKIGKINRTVVTITNDDEFNCLMTRMLEMTSYNVDAMNVHNETWVQQFKDAMNVNGGDIKNANTVDYIMHFLTFGFKIIFACIPPPSLMGGWPCFFISLVMIGILTAIVGDLAAIFGCLVGLKDAVTAITFVALGTSLPDTFASKAAAVGEKNADNAIGNITGSNSVNVFLGLGLPWLIASIYHAVIGKEFIVDAGSLGFSVALYTICAILGIGLLLLRRYVTFFGKAELGGSVAPKYASACFLIILWLLYIALSSLQIYGIIQSPF